MSTGAVAAELPRRTASGISEIGYRPQDLTDDQRVRRAAAMATNPRVRAIAAACTASRGRPRKLPLEVVIAIALLHAMTRPTHMTVVAMLRTIDRLSDNQRERLGVPHGLHVLHKHVWGGLRRISAHVRGGLTVDHDHDPNADPRTGAPSPCPPGCPAGELTEDEVATIVVQASLPPTFQRTEAIAIDGTDIESYYVPYAGGAAAPDGQICADPDVRWGKRTATDRRPNEFAAMYEAHLATYVRPVATSQALPLLCAGLALRPGVQERPAAGIGLVRSVTTVGPITDVILDRGYSTAKAEHFAQLLREMGIALTFDLHSNQRGVRAGPVPGTIWVDGGLYSTALPEPLRKLDPPEVGMTPKEKARIRDVFTARTAYAFVPHSKPVPGRHARRFKGPALAGRVRCPNVPASMRRGHALPTTNCVPGNNCGCGITVSVPDTLHERDRQHLLWQTHAWAASYNRRTLIEGLNAQTRFQAMNVNRGYFRMRGRTANMLLLAFTLAGYNATHLHDWYAGRGRSEPWAQHLGEPADDRPMRRYTRTRGHSHRGPPAITATSPTNHQ